MNKLYIPGDLVMTNGVPLGTAKDVVYRVISSDPIKTLKLNDGTILKGVVNLENIEGTSVGDKGFIFGDCRAYFKDIVPINLVPDILEKNGWKKDEECSFKTQLYYKKKFGVKTIFVIVREDDSIAVCDKVRLRIIKYIHELQHLLFGLDVSHEMKL